jgi:hypothetical protein
MACLLSIAHHHLIVVRRCNEEATKLERTASRCDTITAQLMQDTTAHSHPEPHARQQQRLLIDSPAVDAIGIAQHSKLPLVVAHGSYYTPFTSFPRPTIMKETTNTDSRLNPAKGQKIPPIISAIDIMLSRLIALFKPMQRA